MDNINFDENTINKLKNMINKGDLNDVISQISPEMMQNFSSMMSKNEQTNSENTSDMFNNAHFSNSSGNNNSNNSNNFDFSQIDMNTVLKMKSIIEKLNNSNDPRSNLLHSLKPYMREERKEKLDQYANLLNVAKIADILKDNNKENPNNG